MATRRARGDETDTYVVEAAADHIVRAEGSLAGRVVIGGLVTCTGLALFVMPAFYGLFRGRGAATHEGPARPRG